MNKEGKHEKLRFWRWTEEQLTQLVSVFGTHFSDESLRIMKRIYRKLRRLILENELAKVEHRRASGKLTGKQAQHLRAKVKKSWQ